MLAHVLEDTGADVLPESDKLDWTRTALAFRGFGATNLGRTTDLYQRDEYRGLVNDMLGRATAVCSEVTARQLDLVEFVLADRDPHVESYPEALSLIIAIEMAQLNCLSQSFGKDWTQARLSFGYSLGEVAAVVAGGVFELEEAMRIPLLLADDCVALSREVTLAVLFSRRDELPYGDVQRLFYRINSEGCGVMGMSAHLTPNSYIIIGQHHTLDRFANRMFEFLTNSARLHRDSRKWPPIHTPVLWERNVADHACRLMHTIGGGFSEPVPPVLSLVTGELSYNDYNARDLLCRWTDHPVLLWKAVEYVLADNIDTVIDISDTAPSTSCVRKKTARATRNG